MVVSLTAQAAALVDTAPQNGIPTAAMQQVADVLTEVAQHLDHLQYTTLRYPDGGWLTVRVVEKPAQEGSEPITHLWIPAFGHIEDAQTTLAELSSQAPDLEAAPFGVLELLFLGLGLSRADGIVFYDQAGDRQQGKTVASQPLTEQINQAIQGSAPPPNSVA
ncbi:hypothetical protein L1047_06605 [Synechococcus sp. Nb3U1]|uniref:hypothetical protein n=1 Tax=Synechococcus sp. Nb3U1 TaxID=1914529 RepID=UPI001F44308F|nr:hypothetical protein [Synechococcus sp. Nb3U1]MCF2970865.1 hypothetical protein [Synechococcus sp. Nb3U1]